MKNDKTLPISFDFTLPYKRDNFLSYLVRFLPPDFEEKEENVPFDSKLFLLSRRLGKCKSLSIDVFEFKTKSNIKGRVRLTKEACSVIRRFSRENNMLCVFYSDSEDDYRFSLITTSIKRDQKGNIKEEFSSPHRYSFLLGKDCKHHTAEENLSFRVKDLDDLKERFSTEAVTKQFYNSIFSWYENAIKCVKYPEEIKGEEGVRNEVIRLITRLLFVWFIKEKDLIPEWIFSPDENKKILKDFDPDSKDSGTYYNAILQNLFFGTLNNKIEDRAFYSPLNEESWDLTKILYRDDEEESFFSITQDEVVALFHGIPYLNGGLFECLDHVDIERKEHFIDGFSSKKENRTFIPNKLFFGDNEGIIPILNRFNFTVEENTPLESEVALDPELLGKVFENLLGTFNKETSNLARNDSGSFYTPREIVDFMVSESLKRYLINSLNTMPDIEKKIEILFSDTYDDEEVQKSLTPIEEDKIRSAIKDVRVFDPACGSGAYPVGALGRILSLLLKLSHDNDERYESKEEHENEIYKYKLDIIKNSLYGADIQPIAVQITKLRFFISLICDVVKNDKSEENYGIEPLPNLETKFVSSNTLLKIGGEERSLFEDYRKIKVWNEMKELSDQYFYVNSVDAKENIKKQYITLQNEYLNKLKNEDEISELDRKRISYNPFDQNRTSDFFDLDIMFHISDGFDIVLGNPPYIQLQNNRGELGSLYADKGYVTFDKTGDIYCLFYEKALGSANVQGLLKNGGILCYITSNKWMRAGYGEKLRDFLSENNPLLLIDFGGVKVFESATVDTSILLIEKSKNKGRTLTSTIKSEEDSRKVLSSISKYVKDNSFYSNFIMVKRGSAVDSSLLRKGDSWLLLTPQEKIIKDKIERVGTPLGDWDIQINRGVLTGFNDAFIINEEKRNEILSFCKDDDERKRTEELIKPILRGRDIKRYSYDWKGLYLIGTFPALHYDIEDYPAVKKHLLSFGKERLEQSGKEYTINGERIKSRKKTGNKWFETQDQIGYWKDFEKEKIVYQRITQGSSFALDEKGEFYTNDTSFILTGNCSLQYLIKFLNSQIIEFCFKNFYGTLLGDNGIIWLAQNVVNLPIPLEENIDKKISQKIIESNNDKEIESLISQSIGLTNEEFDYIMKEVFQKENDEVKIVEGDVNA